MKKEKRGHPQEMAISNIIGPVFRPARQSALGHCNGRHQLLNILQPLVLVSPRLFKRRLLVRLRAAMARSATL